MRSSHILSAGVVLLLLLPSGCRLDMLSVGGSAGDDDAPIRTDTRQYTLREEGVGLGTDIDITFRNHSGRTIYLVNCNGLLAPVLEKRVGGEWVPFWSPVLPQCLSEPITIEPGATIARRLQVWGALPGNNWGPEWKSPDVAGTYRIVLHSAVHDYNPNAYPFGPEVALRYRVSNPFTLSR